MKILEAYLGRTVIWGALAAMTVLLVLYTFIDFVNEAEDIGKQGMTVLQAGYLTLLAVPRRVYEIFPAAVLIGSLIGLGNLAAHSELIVMRAAGISIRRVVFSVLKTGVLLMIVAVLIGEYVAPVSEQYAQQLRKVSTTAKQISLKTRHGLWARDQNRFINVKQVFPDQRLGNIRVYSFDAERRLTESVFAKKAVYQDGGWLLSGISRSLISDEGVTTRREQQERWETLVSPDLFDVIVVKPEQMSAVRLAKYVAYLKENGLETRRYALAFWTHFTTPLSSLVMLLLAVPFVFGSVRAGGAGQRLFIGIIIGLIFHMLNRALNNLALVYGIPPIIGAFMPLLIFVAIGLLAIRRLR